MILIYQCNWKQGKLSLRPWKSLCARGTLHPTSVKRGVPGSHQEPGWGPSLEVWGEDGQLREHTSPQNNIKRKENITSAVEVENKQYDSNFVAESSHDRLLSKEKTKSYHPPTTPPPHLAPKRIIIIAFASRLNCEFEENFGSRTHRARKEWVACTSEPACRLATKKKVPPTFLMNSTTSSFVYP